MTTLTANMAGEIAGKFIIPANVLAGAKPVSFTGRGGSRGDAIFIGQGTKVDQVWQAVRQLTYSFWWVSVDPLAQTFTPSENVQIPGIDLRFKVRGTKPVRVQIRGVEAGVPNSTILAEGRIEAAAIQLNGSTRIMFDWPCMVRANTQYAFVVLTDDADSALALAELSKFDSLVQTWVTQQPYQVGVLLSSSNAITWTAHQDKDLWFRLLRSDYGSATRREIDLGTVTVADATDLVLLGASEAPASGAVVDYELTLPNGTKVEVSDTQSLKLAESVTGAIGVKAILRAAGGFSGILHAGTSVAAGTIGATGTYVTRAIPATAGATKLTVIYEAIVPSGATVVAAYSVVGTSTWTTVPASSNQIADNSFREYTCTLPTGVTAESIRVRLTLTGTAAARPRVRKPQVLRT